MTEHVHECRLCSSPTRCLDDCRLDPVQEHYGDWVVSVGELRTCTECEAGLDEIDAKPNPERGQLSGVALIRVVKRAVLAAIDMAKRDPESSPSELARYVNPLSPGASMRERDPDAWYRLGAVCGAKDAWQGVAFRLPPDCPRGDSMMAYTQAWMCSAAVVMEIRMEVGRHG
jgi:hypothetical protein